MPKLEAKLTHEERIIISTCNERRHSIPKGRIGCFRLAAHGTVAKAADEALGEQFRQQAINAHKLRVKITFLWSHLATSNNDGCRLSVHLAP